MRVYQVINWDENFENNKSRERDCCGFVCVPNKQDGLGLTLVLSQQDGAAIYGIWNLIIGACSRQTRPRNGWLTDDGTQVGRPWSVEEMALRWRRSLGEMQRALDFLSSVNVGWIRATELDALGVPVECPSSALEGKRREEKRKEVNPAAQGSAATADAATAAAPPAPVVLMFPTVRGSKNGATEWALREDFLQELREGFPGLDVLAESRKALLWVKTNERKTADGMRRFLNRWMSRANDSRSRRGHGSQEDDYTREALKMIRGSNGK